MTSPRHIRQSLAFAPPWWAIYKPSYIIRRILFHAVSRYAANCSGIVLDFGCGRQPYKLLFAHCTQYLPVDFADTKTKFYANGDVLIFDGQRIPLADSSMDHILCTEVLEHVFTPVSVLAELNRVLRPGGTMLITVPFAWEEHDCPYDYARYTRFGLKYLAEQAGFEVVKESREGNYIQTLTQLACTYLCGRIIPANRFLGRLLEFLLIAPLNLFGAALSFLLPKSNDLFLTTVLLLHKPTRGQYSTVKLRK